MSEGTRYTKGQVLHSKDGVFLPLVAAGTIVALAYSLIQIKKDQTQKEPVRVEQIQKQK